jgi:hypothetical protein
MVVMSNDIERRAREGCARRIQPMTSSPVFGTLDMRAPAGAVAGGPAVTPRLVVTMGARLHAPLAVATRATPTGIRKRLYMTKDNAKAII